MASLLHPRFKSTYIEAERLDYMKVKAAAEMESLADEQRKSAEGMSLPPVGAAEEIPAKKKKKNLGSFFKRRSRKCQAVPRSERESTEMELNSYLQTAEVYGETKHPALRFSIKTITNCEQIFPYFFFYLSKCSFI